MSSFPGCRPVPAFIVLAVGILLASVLLAGCIEEEKAEEATSLPAGSPSFLLALSCTSAAGVQTNLTMAGNELVEAMANLSLVSRTVSTGGTTKNFIGVAASDFLGTLHASSLTMEMRFILSGAAVASFNIVELTVGVGENKVKSDCAILLASGGKWLAEPLVSSSSMQSAMPFDSISMPEWTVGVMLNESNVTTAIGNVSAREMLSDSLWGGVNFTASVLYHGDQTMQGNFTGFHVASILQSQGVNLTRVKAVRFGAIDTPERITLSGADIVNNSQSTKQVAIICTWDDRWIPVSEGGPLRLVPPDDVVGDPGDFPSHYWWKWLASVEVVY